MGCAGAASALGLRQRMRPISPNHGKPVTGVEWESPTWLAEVTIWNTGEADVSTIRLTDDRAVNTHYELADRNALNVLLDELIQLLVSDKLPPAAFVFPVAGDAQLRWTTRLQSSATRPAADRRSTRLEARISARTERVLSGSTASWTRWQIERLAGWS